MAFAEANEPLQVTECGTRKAMRPPIDREHLTRYTFGNLDLELEVLDLFARQAPTTLAALSAAPTDKAWRDAAHALKGSARAVGAWRVAALAEGAERLPIPPEGHARLTSLGALAAALDEACAYIEVLRSHR
jgi:HPt (histidine-containing phosphotransfer) domain-containing protein